MKFWKIYNNSDIRLCFKKINMSNNYANIILDDSSYMMKQLKEIGYAYVLYNSKERRWGWSEDAEYLENNSYKNCGAINLRKDKILKLNEKFK